MATKPSKKAPKLSRKERRAQKKASGEPGRVAQMRQVYRMTKEQDPAVGRVLLGSFVLAFLIGFGLMLLIFPGSWIFATVTGLLFGILALLVMLNRRAMNAAYHRIEGQPGAAAGALQMTLRRGWKIDPAVAVTKQQDVVTRVVGRPGIVLIGEGQGSRVGKLLRDEQQRHARVASEVPIHQVVIGYDEGQVPLPKLAKHVKKMDKQLKPAQMTDVLARIKAVDARRSPLPIPKGPMPTSAKGMRGQLRGR